MRRRRLLSVLALSTLSLAGCGGDRSSTATVTPDPDDPVLFVVDNRQDSPATVRLTLAADDGDLLDESVTLDAGASRAFDPGIATPGQYELTAAIEGGLGRTVTLDIDAADIRSGSNHEVILRDNAVQVTWEA